MVISYHIVLYMSAPRDEIEIIVGVGTRIWAGVDTDCYHSRHSQMAWWLTIHPPLRPRNSLKIRDQRIGRGHSKSLSANKVHFKCLTLGLGGHAPSAVKDLTQMPCTHAAFKDTETPSESCPEVVKSGDARGRLSPWRMRRRSGQHGVVGFPL